MDEHEFRTGKPSNTVDEQIGTEAQHNDTIVGVHVEDTQGVTESGETIEIKAGDEAIIDRSDAGHSNLGIDLAGKPTSDLIDALSIAADALEARHHQLKEGDPERDQIARFKAQLQSLAEYFLDKLTAPASTAKQADEA